MRSTWRRSSRKAEDAQDHIEQYKLALPDVRGAISAARNPETGFLPPILNYDIRTNKSDHEWRLAYGSHFPVFGLRQYLFPQPMPT